MHGNDRLCRRQLFVVDSSRSDSSVPSGVAKSSTTHPKVTYVDKPVIIHVILGQL